MSSVPSASSTYRVLSGDLRLERKETFNPGTIYPVSLKLGFVEEILGLVAAVEARAAKRRGDVNFADQCVPLWQI